MDLIKFLICGVFSTNPREECEQIMAEAIKMALRGETNITDFLESKIRKQDQC